MIVSVSFDVEDLEEHIKARQVYLQCLMED